MCLYIVIRVAVVLPVFFPLPLPVPYSCLPIQPGCTQKTGNKPHFRPRMPPFPIIRTCTLQYCYMYKFILRKNTVVRGDYDGVWFFPDLVGIDVVVVGLRQYFGYGDRLCEGHDPNHHGILQVTRDHQGQIRRGERGKAVLGVKTKFQSKIL